MRHVIGLDFGTTNSAIAVAYPTGSTTLATFQEGDHQTTFRSVLYFDAEVRGPDGKPRAIAGPPYASAAAHRIAPPTMKISWPSPGASIDSWRTPE